MGATQMIRHRRRYQRPLECEGERRLKSSYYRASGDAPALGETSRPPRLHDGNWGPTLSIFRRKKHAPDVASESADYRRYETENPDGRLDAITGGSPFAQMSDVSMENVEERVEHRLGVEDDSTATD
jgi:hypothetical protein